jgi:hypothetical protein
MDPIVFGTGCLLVLSAGLLIVLCDRPTKL